MHQHLTREQHRSMLDFLNKVPMNAVLRFHFTVLINDQDVHIVLNNFDDPTKPRKLRIKPDGTITEKQEVEVTL